MLSIAKKVAFGGKKVKSFTLIELIVVISIIMILSAFMIYSLGPARTRSRDNRRISDANLIGSALDQYYTDNLRVYPKPQCNQSNQTFSDTSGNTYCYGDASVLGQFLSSYLSPMPSDPSSFAGNYVYLYRNDGKKAAVVIGKFETGAKLCNATSNLPLIVDAYKSAGNPVCYYVAR
jgi:type II secretory pathway pseudopilin PulG